MDPHSLKIKFGDHMLLCSGCGVCASVCKSEKIKMQLDANGEYKPILEKECKKGCGKCTIVCPFMNWLKTNELIKKKFRKNSKVHYNEAVGYYTVLYEGYSEVYRPIAASGGLLTHFLVNLFDHNFIDGVLCVSKNTNPNKLFEYRIINNISDLEKSSGSAYYPVELSTVLKDVRQKKGRFALVGLPCVLRAVELVQKTDKRANENIILKLGLTCGQIQNTEFLKKVLNKKGIDIKNVYKIQFREREKNINIALGIKVITKTGDAHYLNFDDFGKIWISGENIPTACLFCEDLYAESSDISFMDAWLSEYQKERYGKSLVITRTEAGTRLWSEVFSKDNEAKINCSNLQDVIRSQKNRIINKKKCISYRLDLLKKWGIEIQNSFPVRKNNITKKQKISTSIKLYKNLVSHNCYSNNKMLDILITIDRIKNNIVYFLKTLKRI